MTLTTKQRARLADLERDLIEYEFEYRGDHVQLAIQAFLDLSFKNGNFSHLRAECHDGWYQIRTAGKGGLDTTYLAMAAEAAMLRGLRDVRR